MGGWEGWGVGREEAKAPQLNTQGLELPTDGRRTSFRSRVEFQADSTGVNVSVMVLQGCKSSPQKSRPLESGHLC